VVVVVVVNAVTSARSIKLCRLTPFPLILSQNAYVWALTYKSSTPPKRDEWEGHPGKVRSEVESLLKKKNHGDDHPAWEVLEKTKDDRILHFGLFDRRHKSQWTKGRYVMSCHV